MGWTPLASLVPLMNASHIKAVVATYRAMVMGSISQPLRTWRSRSIVGTLASAGVMTSTSVCGRACEPGAHLFGAESGIDTFMISLRYRSSRVGARGPGG